MGFGCTRMQNVHCMHTISYCLRLRTCTIYHHHSIQCNTITNVNARNHIKSSTKIIVITINHNTNHMHTIILHNFTQVCFIVTKSWSITSTHTSKCTTYINTNTSITQTRHPIGKKKKSNSYALLSDFQCAHNKALFFYFRLQANGKRTNQTSDHSKKKKKQTNSDTPINYQLIFRSKLHCKIDSVKRTWS